MSFVRPIEILEPNLTENRSAPFEEVTGSALPETESRTKSLKRGAKLRLNETTYYSTVRNLEVPTPKADSDQAKLLDIMIKYGNNPDGIPALLYAAKKGDQEAVKLLLAHGADIQTKNGGGAGILRYALLSKDKDLVRFVLDQGVDVNAFEDALHVFFTDEPELFDLLIERGFNYKSEFHNRGEFPNFYQNYKDEECLTLFCILCNSSKLLRHLIQKGYSVNSDGIWTVLPHTDLSFCHLEQRLDLFNYLLKIGILNPLTQGYRAFYTLSTLPASFLQSCFDNKFNINALKCPRGQTLLYKFCCVGYDSHTVLEKIQLLVKNGAQVNENKDGDTPLMMAVAHNRKETVRLLLENGADPNLKDNEGRSAIFYSGDIEMKKLLREFGAKD